MGLEEGSAFRDYGDPMDPVGTYPINRSSKMLHAQRVAQTRQFHPAATKDIVDVETGIMTREIVAYIYADHLAQDTYERTASLDFPSSPWQFFKLRHHGSWWLGWLVQRRPVVTKAHRVKVGIEVDRFLRYPDLEISDQRLGAPVIFERTTFMEQECL